MDLLPFEQVVTVESAPDEGDPAASGLSLTRRSAAAVLPANGRDLHAYYAIVPGATITPASSGGGGQFTVDGQRPNTNSVRIDGISGNTGLGISATPGTYSGSSLPGMTVIGSTQNLASKEDIERVELRSSDFAPEYGDRPGAQIDIETRSGSNRFHGNVLGYFRPRQLDSRDWFARRYDSPLEAASLSGYGASLGGPLFPDRTFFFAAFEKVDIHDTALKLMPTPSASARAAAKNSYGLLLNAFPLPTGPSLNADESLATLPLEKQASVENYSLRIDQTLGDKGRLFARYANVPSRSVTKDLGISNAGFRWVSATLGATTEWKGAIHDFRFNFSRLIDTSSWAAGSAREQAAFDAFSNPAFTPYTPSTVTGISIAGIGQLLSGVPERTYQNQWEGAYTLAKQFGRHDFRAGADYIRLLPRTLVGNFVQTTSIVSPGVESLLAGDPLGVTASFGKPTIQSGEIPIASLFVQDTFKLNSRLNILYGLRWELTPPGDTALGSSFTSIDAWHGPGTGVRQIAGITGFLNLSNWQMHYTQIAPRLGLAYHLRKADLVLRAGGGLFYDDAIQSLIHPVSLSPLNTWQFLPSKSNVNPVPPAIVFPDPPELSLPEVWEWRASIEKSLKGHSTLSLAYVGSAGRKLLRLQGSVYPESGILKGTAFTSYGRSDYEALEAQLTGNLLPNLYALVSYTWGHSIDTGSEASSVFLAEPGYTGAQDRGSSNFDVRHNLS
ncbi:MAG: TonB-dependent receptor domain-containing protein, partial [Terriglobia bacterium]